MLFLNRLKDRSDAWLDTPLIVWIDRILQVGILLIARPVSRDDVEEH